ncbi:MAG: sugar kinase [Bacteroidia bacterium]
MKIEYAIIVKNKTRLETLLERFNTKAQSKFYIEKMGGNFEEYEQEHDKFHQALTSLQSQLSTVMKHKIIERQFVSSYIFSANQLIVVIGQDGLVANTAKYSKNIPIVAVNPDKTRYDGVLLPFEVSNFLKGVRQVMNDTFQAKTMRFAEAKLNDGQRLLAFNDLFIGAATHISARYKITHKQKSEEHSSSGIIVSTQAGATGWLSSVFNMAHNLLRTGDKKTQNKQPQFQADELMFVVREPFKSQRTQTKIGMGIITTKNTLTLESYMPMNGVIFSDGIEDDFLHFNSGAIATIGIAPETARLVLNV